LPDKFAPGQRVRIIQVGEISCGEKYSYLEPTILSAGTIAAARDRSVADRVECCCLTRVCTWALNSKSLLKCARIASNSRYLSCGRRRVPGLEKCSGGKCPVIRTGRMSASFSQNPPCLLTPWPWHPDGSSL